ncbi:hypothetical protein CN692_23715 [Bacillus sp. AFS002410]|nr:hypothetical protein CN692_23715 [Bacillus sp. AFS002410]
MNLFRFFIYLVVFSIIGIANNYFFKGFSDQVLHINNKLVVSMIKTLVDLIILYFTFKLYFNVKNKLRYKILIHIGAFIVGTVILVIISNNIDL